MTEVDFDCKEINPNQTHVTRSPNQTNMKGKPNQTHDKNSCPKWVFPQLQHNTQRSNSLYNYKLIIYIYFRLQYLF